MRKILLAVLCLCLFAIPAFAGHRHYQPQHCGYYQTYSHYPHYPRYVVPAPVIVERPVYIQPYPRYYRVVPTVSCAPSRGFNFSFGFWH